MKKALDWAYLFIRFPALSFTALVPLLGAASVSPHVPLPHALDVVAVAVMFHIFAYVLNDVVDLPIDRTERWRADCPLVRQSVRPGHALLIALAQAPLALVTTAAMGWGAGASAALAAAMTLMTAYNLWGKRCPIPLLTDAVQGLSWAALAAYGAFTAGRPGEVTLLLAAHVLIYVMMINGVHGGLRDLANDWRCRARTTAIFLGARPDAGGGLVLPRRFVAYTVVLQGALLSLTLARLLHGIPGGSGGPGPAAIALGAGLSVASVMMLAAAMRAANDAPKVGLVGTLHLVMSLGVLLSLYGVSLNGGAVATALAVYGLPMLAMWARNGSTWG